MSVENTDRLKALAPDLATQNPRHRSETLGGFEGGMRALDKCRATLAGTQADYIFNCPLDQRFFAKTGIDADEFKNVVATGASDEEMDEWVRNHAKASNDG